MKKYLLAAAVIPLVAILLLTARGAINVQAAPTDFQLTALDCSTQPGSITITNRTSATAGLGSLAVQITPPGSAPAASAVIDSLISPANSYAAPAGGTITVRVGPGATQSPMPATNPLPANQTVALSTTSLLVPGSVVTLFDNAAGTVIGFLTCQTPNPPSVFAVSPNGFDFLDAAQTIPNTTCAPVLFGSLPTQLDPGPCLTFQHALLYTRDGDIIFVEGGVYEVCAPITVDHLVRITSLISAVTAPADLNGATPPPGTPPSLLSTPAPGVRISSKAVLHSFTGDTVFHVTAVGYPSVNSPSNFPNSVPANLPPGALSNQNNHVLIDGLFIGGAFKPGAAAILLDNDAYTDVRFNVIGGEPLNNPSFTGIPCAQPQPVPPLTPAAGPVTKSEVFGNANGIILQNSNHPNIFENTILGSSIFKYSPTLAIGEVQTGFGIISAECLGQGPDASEGITIAFNAVNRNLNAGIWLCSDGGGGHLISTNAVKLNGRGIVLRAVTDTLIDTNTVSDSYADGIVIYDDASNNTIQRNLIESQRTPGAAGIRVGGFGGSLFPLQTAINYNTLRRNYYGVVVAGARNTTGTGNVITAEDTRTGILLQVGSTGSPSVTQPIGTVFNLNQIVFNGTCGAAQGCAIREDKLVTADMDAAQNSFGLPRATDVNSVLWHKPNDPQLGFISASQPNAVAAVPTGAPGIGAPGAVGGGIVVTATTGAAVAPQNLPVAGAGAVSPSAASTPQIPAGPVPSGATSPGTSPVLGSSPVLQGGPPNGSTTYSPPCNLVNVPSTVGVSISSALFLSQFQPVSNIFSAWRFNNASHVYQALYFADAGAPVDAVLLRPGDVVSLCLSGNVTGPP